MIKIKLFESNETDFNHNGIILDDIAISQSCFLTNEINGKYVIEAELTTINNNKWTLVEEEKIICVNADNGEELFRIKEINKTLDRIKIFGHQVFFDLENNFIMDTFIVNKDCRNALNQIMSNTLNTIKLPYSSSSDISLISNSRLVRKNVVSAIIGSDDNSIINRYGGELYTNKFNFAINQRIGSDRNFSIRYGKNLTGFNAKIDTYNLCTRIVPIGYNGLMLEGVKHVDSTYINNYSDIYTKEVKFDDVKEEDFNSIDDARNALRIKAEEFFTNTDCDLPSFNAKVSFATLRNTVEYASLSHLEKVSLGDDIHVYITKLGIDLTARVVKTKWNFYTQRYVEIEVGEISENIYRTISSIKNTIDKVVKDIGGISIQDIINQANIEAEKLINAGIKNSYVVLKQNELLIMDNPDVNLANNIIRANKNGIAFGQNGYNGNFGVAITIDGKINADFISSGTIQANLIKAGVLSSANNKTWINMEDGTFNFSDKVKFDGNKFEVDFNNKSTAFNLCPDSNVRAFQEGRYSPYWDSWVTSGTMSRGTDYWKIMDGYKYRGFVPSDSNANGNVYVRIENAKPNTEYRIELSYLLEFNTNEVRGQIHIFYFKEDGTQISGDGSWSVVKGAIQRIDKTITTPAECTNFKIHFLHPGIRGTTDNHLFIGTIMVSEGSDQKEWTPKGDEVSSATFNMNPNGDFKITTGDNSVILSSSGIPYCFSDSIHAPLTGPTGSPSPEKRTTQYVTIDSNINSIDRVNLNFTLTNQVVSQQFQGSGYVWFNTYVVPWQNIEENAYASLGDVKVQVFVNDNNLGAFTQGTDIDLSRYITTPGRHKIAYVGWINKGGAEYIFQTGAMISANVDVKVFGNGR